MTDVNLLLLGVVGSRAYGLDHDGSDTDRLGVFAAPTMRLLGLERPQDTYVTKEPEGDRTLHEALKFCKLALKSNPTVTELLWLEDYEVCDKHGAALVGLRKQFLSAHYVRNAYFGYAYRQFLKLANPGESGPGLAEQVPRRAAKHARHMYRLLLQGRQLCLEGELTIRLADAAPVWDFGERVAAGDTAYAEEVLNRFAHLFDTRYSAYSALPREPDTAAAESWLLDVRKAYGG